VSRGARWARRGGTALLLTAALAGAAPISARAQDSGYRYWSFWEGEDGGGWSYATQGPGTWRPGEGDVLGFRFAVSTEASDAHQPRGEAAFGPVCGDSAEGRVALVIDFGTPAHAPDGERPPEPRTECAPADDGATVAEILAEVVEPLRYDSSGLLCAIAGYPEQGCGEQVSTDGDSTDSTDPTDASGTASDEESGDDGGGGGSSTVAVLAGVGVVALLAAAALRRSRAGRGRS
jgi:MYXO-CTERM domain-containing protein